ncbi:hypothetical protein [Rubritalea tangerina]|uniref:hypothetical protein n=1 Tax=Rubritalea tangerina TaxID=430798 RepID=UPI003609CF45
MSILSTLCATSLLPTAEAQVNYNGDLILEVRLADMAANPNPTDLIEGWSAFIHEVASNDPNSLEISGVGTSNYAVGSGLWFGLFAMNNDGTGHDLVASTVVGAKPTAEITFTSKDTNSDPANPRTRADVPFGVSVKVVNLSDDALLSNLENGETFAPSTKVMKLSLVTKDESGAAMDNGVADYLSTESAEFNLTQVVSSTDTSVTHSADEIFTHLTSPEGTRGIRGTETIDTYVMVNEDEANPDWLIRNSASIRILPTAYASDFDYDGAEKVLKDGDVLDATPSQISVWGYQLYPGSKTKVTIYRDAGGVAQLIYESDEHVVDVDDVQNQRFVLGKELYESAMDQDGVNYTVILETTTVLDYDETLGASTWIELNRVSFSLDREVLVNGIMVTGENN